MLPKISYRLRHPAIDVLLEVVSAVVVVGLELVVRVILCLICDGVSCCGV